jgi:hypothetical protein
MKNQELPNNGIFLNITLGIYQILMLYNDPRISTINVFEIIRNNQIFEMYL